MKDVISINRNFLLMARNASQDASGSLVTGLPKELLEKIGTLSFDQIEQLASSLPCTAFTVRFNEGEIDRLVAPSRAGSTTTQYALSLVAAGSR